MVRVARILSLLLLIGISNVAVKPVSAEGIGYRGGYNFTYVIPGTNNGKSADEAGVMPILGYWESSSNSRDDPNITYVYDGNAVSVNGNAYYTFTIEFCEGEGWLCPGEEDNRSGAPNEGELVTDIVTYVHRDPISGELRGYECIIHEGNNRQDCVNKIAQGATGLDLQYISSFGGRNVFNNEFANQGENPVEQDPTPSENEGDPTEVPISNIELDCESNNLNSGNCKIIEYLVTFINVLSALFGIVAVTMIVYAGIRYTMSQDNPQTASEAKERIRNVVIAVVAYIFTYAFLNYLIPGGLF